MKYPIRDGVSGLVVKSIVAIDGPRVRFAADALLLLLLPGPYFFWRSGYSRFIRRGLYKARASEVRSQKFEDECFATAFPAFPTNCSVKPYPSFAETRLNKPNRALKTNLDISRRGPLFLLSLTSQSIPCPIPCHIHFMSSAEHPLPRCTTCASISGAILRAVREEAVDEQVPGLCADLKPDSNCVNCNYILAYFARVAPISPLGPTCRFQLDIFPQKRFFLRTVSPAWWV